MRRSPTRSKTTTPTDSCAHRVRICANKVVACVRLSTLLLNIRPHDTRQCASARQIDQLEGLAVAIAWGFEAPFPHQPSLRILAKAVRRSRREAARRRTSPLAARLRLAGQSHAREHTIMR